MTQKERIEQLEREVNDLRNLVASLQGQVAARPFIPYVPPQPYRPRPYPYPGAPWASGSRYESATISTPPNADVIHVNC